MLDLKDICNNIDGLRRAVRLRRVPPEKANVGRWLELDEQRRRLVATVEGLHSEKKLLAALGKSDPVAAREKGQVLREKLKEAETELGRVESDHGLVPQTGPIPQCRREPEKRTTSRKEPGSQEPVTCL